jgi:hypothetical protein
MRANCCEDHKDCIVVYEGNKCPLCEIQNHLETAQNDLTDAQDKIEELTRQ